MKPKRKNDDLLREALDDLRERETSKRNVKNKNVKGRQAVLLIYTSVKSWIWTHLARVITPTTDKNLPNIITYYER